MKKTGISRYLRLTWLYAKKAVKVKLIYRWSFLINCISQALDYAVTFLLMVIMISSFETMNGWNQYEVMLLYAISLLSYGVAGTFFFLIMVNLPQNIHNGAFDDVLVKPVSVLPYLISSSFISNYIAHITLSVIIMIICFIKLNVTLTIFYWVTLFIMVISGGLIYGGLFLMVSASAFLFTKIQALMDVMFFFREASYYPISILPVFMQVIMTFVIPYSMINFFPIQIILPKNDFLFLNKDWIYLSPLFAVIFFSLICCYFYWCLKHYKSTGS